MQLKTTRSLKPIVCTNFWNSESRNSSATMGGWRLSPKTIAIARKSWCKSSNKLSKSTRARIPESARHCTDVSSTGSHTSSKSSRVPSTPSATRLHPPEARRLSHHRSRIQDLRMEIFFATFPSRSPGRQSLHQVNELHRRRLESFISRNPQNCPRARNRPPTKSWLEPRSFNVNTNPLLCPAHRPRCP
jgi:hypothetical protein